MRRNEIILLAKKAADALRNTDTYHQAAQIIDMLISELEGAGMKLIDADKLLNICGDIIREAGNSGDAPFTLEEVAKINKDSEDCNAKDWKKCNCDNKSDMVNHPLHYSGEIECIDAIESAVAEIPANEAICVSNIIKYIWRYRNRNGMQDLKKAEWYLHRLMVNYNKNDK